MAATGARGELTAGVATSDVTPPWPVRKAFIDGAPFVRSYQRVEVKALALRDGDEKIVIVVADIGYFQAPITRRIRAAVAGLGLEPRQLVLNATHNHSGPALCYPLDVVREADVDPRYVGFFVAETASAIRRALASASPARLALAQAECDVAINKRLHGQMMPNPQGPADRRVRLLKVLRPTGELRAALFLYGCHPSDMNDSAFGSDFFGYAREELEYRNPGVVFLSAQGTGGDTRCDHRLPNHTEFLWGTLSTLPETRALGVRLADSVTKALQAPAEEIGGPLRSSLQEIQLPLGAPEPKEQVAKLVREAGPGDLVWRQRWADVMYGRYDQKLPFDRSVPYTIQAVAIGAHFRLLALDGEVFTGIGRAIEARLGSQNTYVLGYSNTAAGYIPTAEEIPRGGAEIGYYFWWNHHAPFSTATEPTLVEAAVRLARALD